MKSNIPHGANASTSAKIVGTSGKKPRIKKIPRKTNETVLIQPGPTDKPLPKIEDVLKFIEGNTNKKAAKKAKQKQKKLSVQRVEELEQLREDFHDILFNEAEAKSELKLLKPATKKDRKKINEVESSVKKLGKLRAETESRILELIAELKNNNADFKFAYLPTKEQQLERRNRDNNPPSAVQPAIKLPKNSFDYHGDIIDPEHFADNSSGNVSLQYGQKQNCEVSLDPSQRMVTIRRVNVPHTEAQVSVIAKGLSPDKDKLLYTFVNGQLVNAANQPGPRNTASVSMIQQFNLTHQQLQQQNSNAAAVNQTTVAATNSTKIEKKAAKTKKELNKQSPSENITNKNSSNDTGSSKCDGSTNSCATTITQKRKDKKLKAQLAKQSSFGDDSRAESDARNVKSKAKGMSPVACSKTKRNSVEAEPQSKATEDSQLENKLKKGKHRKVKVPKYEYAGPQNKANKFDVLDMDDDDDDYYISEEESVSSGTTSTEDHALQQQNSKKNPTKAYVSNKNAKQANVVRPRPNTTKTEKSKPKKELPTQLKKEKTSVEAEVPLSKNQKKKLAQQQARQESQVNADASVEAEVPLSKKQMKKLAQRQARQDSNAEASVTLGDSLNNAMHTLRLNDDTTTEMDNYGAANCTAANSIMDQLNRGIKIDELVLPHGITLTPVSPGMVAANRARMESIARISQPMPPVPPAHQYMSNSMNFPNPMMMPMNIPGRDPNSFVMIDPMSNTNGQLSKQELLANAAKAKLKRRKRKGKNKKSDETPPADASDQVVTLRNPMFHANNEVLRQPMPGPSIGRPAAPVHVDQPAAIIKNDNGMFTIRRL